jgi:alpha-galactosidase
MTPEDRAEIAPQVADYLRMERLVLEGDFYRLASPFTGREFAVLLVSKDKTEAHLTFMQLLRVVNCEPLFLRLQGLDPEALYHVEELDITLHGSTLMEAGLHMPNHRMADFETLTYHIHKV